MDEIDRLKARITQLEATLQAIRESSVRDPLTGVFNRRYLEETVAREIVRCTWQGKPLSIIFFDFDDFKSLNDRFGHVAVDGFLARFGVILRGWFRADDIPCRFGGDEFIVVLPEAQANDAIRRAETLRVAVRKLSYSGIENVSASMGVATFPDHGSNLEQLIRSADSAMYLSKQNGRNCVSVAAREMGHPYIGVSGAH